MIDELQVVPFTIPFATMYNDSKSHARQSSAIATLDLMHIWISHYYPAWECQGGGKSMERMMSDLRRGATIKVVGVGGGGGNAINHMIEWGLKGVEFVVINTDVQDLAKSLAENKVQIGQRITGGLGTGGNPEIGRQAAEQDRDTIAAALEHPDMVFIAVGMGGGTGTGASPIVAQVARELGALTVAVVTKPFTEEGLGKARIAEEGIEQLKQIVDAIITIPNDRIWQLSDKRMTLKDAFAMVDDVLRQAVQGISDLITIPGYINIDFADVKSVLMNAGVAMIGIGVGRGDERCIEAARNATLSPLLEHSIQGATKALLNIIAPADMPAPELQEVMRIIKDACGTEELDMRIGIVLDDQIVDEVRITLIATGFERKPSKQPEMAEQLERLRGQPRVTREEKREPTSKVAEVTPDARRVGPSRDVEELLRELEEGVEDIDMPTFLRSPRRQPSREE
ncbi:MAG: cell division protein FtsZ [Armatimonadota bacterium]|nr:cell division protein FtsZ [Armatimonadota bacterium]MCX7778134.1 cell division protein FtsZ [Armatimonadota bacterium]MDW8024846.1 cell division protein FtsZ [Armatimonadota bacterium]